MGAEGGGIGGSEGRGAVAVGRGAADAAGGARGKALLEAFLSPDYSVQVESNSARQMERGGGMGVCLLVDVINHACCAVAISGWNGMPGGRWSRPLLRLTADIPIPLVRCSSFLA